MNSSAIVGCVILLALTEAFAVLTGVAIGIPHGWQWGVIVTLVAGYGFYVCVDVMAMSYLHKPLRSAVASMIFRGRKS